jgi:hypothetical protein
MSGLKKRIANLEAAAGSDECERCGGTLVVTINDQVHRVSKYGHPLPQPAAVAFVAQEQPDNRCPLCGTYRRQTNIGSYRP